MVNSEFIQPKIIIKKKRIQESKKKKTKIKIKITRKCIQNSTKQLRSLQKRVINHINKNDSLLVIHGTGCGKTIAAVIASQCFLESHPNKRVVFVSPASLVSNFKNELLKEKVKNIEKYDFFSYHKFLNLKKNKKGFSCKNKMLIIDEAHNIRSKINLKKPNKITMVKAILDCAYSAEKRLLLTATPFVNSPQDFINLINILHGKEICGTRSAAHSKNFK